MTSLPFDDLGPPGLRWGTGFVAVSGLFAGALWLVANRHIPAEPPPAIAAPPAVMIDLTPPAPPPPTPASVPPAPVVPPPPLPMPLVPPPVQPPQIVPPVPPAPAPEVAVPLPPKPVEPPEPKPLPRKPVVHQPPLKPVAMKPVAEPAAPEAPAPLAAQPPAPPAPAAAPPRTSNAAPNWRGAVLGQLGQFKRYPLLARKRHEEGTATLRFTMTRDGGVLTAEIVKSSGFDDLDQETLALIRRVGTLPKPPSEVTGDPVELMVPIAFSLSQG